MRGKRFSTPAGDSATRTAPNAQPHSFSSPSAGRWKSPVATSSRVVRDDHRLAPPLPQQRASAQHPSRVPRTPERRVSAMAGGSTLSSMPGASVHHMLSELVDLSHSIAALLEQESQSASPAVASAARQAEAGLKTQEIERIVRRVEAHFVDKIQSLEATNATLKDEVRHLRSALEARERNGAAKGGAGGSADVRDGLREEIEALDALDRAWAGEGNGSAALTEAEQLRRVLLAEKRQRLRVEEQTQSLTEQHAKVVGTLERRLKKQEEQLYDLIAAIDRGYSGGTSSPARSTERGTPHRLATPRHLLRQQLAQHQQTQRALQEYKENLRFETPTPSPTQSDDAAAMEELGLDDVRRTLESIRSSRPLTVTEPAVARAAATGGGGGGGAAGTTPSSAPPQDEPEIVFATVTTAPTPPPPPAQPAVQRPALVSSREVDEITSFLDNITRELESLDAA